MAVDQSFVNLCTKAHSLLGALITTLLLIGIIWLLLDWAINRNKPQAKRSRWPKIIIGTALILALLYVLMPSILSLWSGGEISSLEDCKPDIEPYCGREYCTNKTAFNETRLNGIVNGTSCTCTSITY